jgi:excisionase family DNA binding protein
VNRTPPRLEAEARRRAEHRLDLAGRLALRPAEAATALGVSERTLRSMLSRLPHFREGGAVLIPVRALERWLEERVKAEGNALARLEEEFAAQIRASGRR